MSHYAPMKRSISLWAMIGVVCWGSPPLCSGSDPPIAVAIGTAIHDLKFKDIRCLSRSLRDLGDHRAYVFVFTTTKCPLVKKYLPKLTELHRKYRDQDVVFISVNVGAEDTIRDVAAQAIEFDIPFPFVKDTEASCAAALGVTRTPEVAVLDQGRRLVYRGRIDDQMRIGGTLPAPTRSDLDTALAELFRGQPISVPETTVDGCRITPPDSGSPRTDITYHKDLAPILLKRCAGCHRPESAAPFALQSFEDAVGNAEMIAEVVRDESMPPWYASPHFGTFQNDASLTPAEKRLVLDWIAAGCPEGDISQTPPVPESPTSPWRIGKPDLVITTLQEHDVPATGFVPYRYAVLPYLFLAETWVEAVEIRPLNPAVVHHCNMAYVTTEGASEDTFITGHVPGGQPLDLSRFGSGVAYKIPAGATLGLQIHYTTTGREEKSKIQVGFRYARGTIQKQLHHFLLDPRGWTIPPRDPAFAIRESHLMPHDADLLGMFTHMHVRGRDMTFYATYPNETREVLLQIPNYNFEWQLGYELKPGTKQLPKGTKVEAIAHFDNSPFNPYNPDPEKEVGYGPQTVDEMFNGFVFYTIHDQALNLAIDPATGQVASTTPASPQPPSP